MMRPRPTPGTSMTTPRTSSLTLLALLCAVSLTSCDVFDRDAPTDAYFLLAPAAQPKVDGAKLGSVVLRRASVVRPFGERGFVYKLSNGQWRIDAYNGFLADPIDMITDALLRDFDSSGRFTFVAGAGIVTATDFAAEVLVEEFFTDFTDPAKGVAVVSLRAYLVDRRTERGGVHCTLLGTGRVPLHNGSPMAVAEALSAATAQAIAGVVSSLPASTAPTAP